ncbi:MAG: hypothetical protein V1904_14830 [Bacteroidota bacterium]
MNNFYFILHNMGQKVLFAVIFFGGVSVQLSFGQNNVVKDTLNPISPIIKTQTNDRLDNSVNVKIEKLEKVETQQCIQKLDNIESVKSETKESALKKINDNEINESLLNNGSLTNGNSLPDTSHNTQHLNLQKTNDQDNPEIKKRRTELKKSLQEHGLKSVPANDDICDATTLSLDGTCLTGQTNVEATSDYYGGCTQPGNPSVWYTFTVTAPNDYLTIEIKNGNPPNREVQAFLMDGTCANPSGISVQCELTPIVFEFYHMTPGTYFLMVSTQPGVGNELISFDICATQGIAPPLAQGPEQDCDGALPVCNQIYVQDLSYTDYWDTDEIPDATTCLYTGENNSVWYIFTVQANGDFSFTLNTTKDYDFALYNLTLIGGCDAIPTSTPVLCNYSDDYGLTGATLPVNATIPRGIGWNGPATMPGIPVTAGTTYVLIVDNWTGDAAGYTLDFGTSPVVDVTKPYMVSASASCTDNTIMITMNEEVKCLTVSENDFILTNTTTGQNFTGAITSIVGYDCFSGGFATQIQITHNGTLTSGVYEIEINTNPVLADKCDNIINAGSTINFNYLANITLTPNVTLLCDPWTVNFIATGAPKNQANIYNLNPGNLFSNSDASGNGAFNGVNVSTTTMFTLSVTYGGCTKTSSATITVQDNVIVSISPVNPQVCAGTADLTATATINGVPCTSCNYSWNGGAYTENGVASSIWANRPVGTYTVTVSTAAGCAGDNTASSTVSLASAGGGSSCNIYYVNSVSGAGDCLTKGTPGGLITALGLANCNNAIIKMQIGIYNLSDRVNVNSYVTIEGGFTSNFTIKTSNMSGNANSTTIRRDRTADSDDATACTAFKVQPSATAFHFQDLRIELPGSPNVTAHTAGSGLSNYAIKMGTGCTSYDIVRCYIDAGKGSDP